MKVTYIHHSAFGVQLAGCSLLFDYFEGELPDFPKDKPLYVFASHKHGDHFSLRIFALKEQYEDVTFILSNDIRLNEGYLRRKGIDTKVKEHMVSIGKNQKREIGLLTVETLRSTDEGVAFVVEADGVRLYHAGDLNWWYWKEEPEPWNSEQERDYKRELSYIKGRRFDAAFVPLDGRLEERYCLGLDTFFEYAAADVVFPMHCWGDFSVIDAYKAHAGSLADCVMSIHGDGEVFELPEKVRTQSEC